jgi:hypothetical protein
VDLGSTELAFLGSWPISRYCVYSLQEWALNVITSVLVCSLHGAHVHD